MDKNKTIEVKKHTKIKSNKRLLKKLNFNDKAYECS